MTLLSISAHAQEAIHPERCGQSQMNEAFQLLEPEVYAIEMQLRHQVLEMVEAEAANRTTPPTDGCPDGIRIIPIFMHILHNGGSPTVTGNNNFTVAEIQKAITRLNEHFQGSSPLIERVQNRFLNDDVVAVNTCIQFCWNPEDIRRVNVGSFEFVGTVVDADGAIIPDRDSQIASPIINRCEHVNVYVGNYGFNQFGIAGVLGYAKPFHSGQAGVRVDDNVFVPNGILSNVVDTSGGTLAHEMGHYLGLPHIWGDVNVPDSLVPSLNPATFCHIDDGFADTPNQGRPCEPWGVGAGIPTWTPEEDVVHCGNAVMYTNFMDYSRSDWMVNFSRQQVAFMRSYLNELEQNVQSAYWLLSPCTPSAGFLRGTDYCYPNALACAQPNAQVPSDTVRICGSDTINLNAYTQLWGYNSSVSPTTEYTWLLNGVPLPFPAKTPVVGNSPICTPDTFAFRLNMRCAISGEEQLGGRVTVLAFLTPDQLVQRYLRSGDCQHGPGPVYSEADLAAGCDGLMSFTPDFSPIFPVTFSGTMQYTATFSPLVVNGCCTDNCDREAERHFSCHVSAFDCDGLSFSGGVHMVELTPCPDHDLDATFEGYENSSVSISDPNGLVSGFYYFADEDRTEFFDPLFDYYYEGNGCEPGNTVTVHTSLGCDTDSDGTPNLYVNVGTVTFSQIAPPPSAPALSMSVNMDAECSYAYVPACPDDDITPWPLPIQSCGSGFLEPITASVMNEWGCAGEFNVSRPACPECPPATLTCGPMNFNGGMEEVCSGSTLANGFPQIQVGGITVPNGAVYWSRGPMAIAGAEIYPTQINDVPDDLGPVFHSSDPLSGMPESVVFFANVFCNHDNDPSTPTIPTMIGGYEVVILPVPDVRMVAVCLPDLEEQFHVEVKVMSNVSGIPIIATNSLDSDELHFTAAGTQYFGPYDNGDTVRAEIGYVDICTKKSGPLTANCTPGWCVPPTVTFLDTCLLNGGEEQFFLGVTVTEAPSGLLFDVTSTMNDDTLTIDPSSPTVIFGPLTGSFEVTVTDHAYPGCATVSGIVPDPCLLTALEEPPHTIGLTAYPVPAMDAVTVRATGLPYGAVHALWLTDVLGRRLRTLPTSAVALQEGMTVPIDGIAPGVYLLMLTGLDGAPITVTRMVKAH